MCSINTIRTQAFIAALILLLAIMGTAFPAHAQSDILDSAGSVFEAIARGLNRVGETTQRLFRPQFSPLGNVDVVDFSGKTPVAREYIDNFPVRPNATLSISNEFGEIRVQPWDNPVIQVQADILVAGDTYDLAQEISKAVNISVDARDDRVDIRTDYPPPPDRGRIAKEVNYLVRVPRGINLNIRNSFGDTVVKGIEGKVGIDSQFGALTLRDLSGNVRVRARGELPLTARNLRKGGSFELRGVKAEFAEVAGSLVVNSFLGSVTLRELAQDVDIDVSCDSGSIILVLNDQDDPAIDAHVLFGTLYSDVTINPTSSGDLTFGHRANPEARQRIALHTSFGDIEIRNEDERIEMIDSGTARGVYTEGVVRKEIDLPEGTKIVVDAIVGNVRIEGVDSDRAHLRATQVVRMEPDANPRPAIEALDVNVTQIDDGQLSIRTAVRDDMGALGCSYYRIDLVLTVPRTSRLQLNAADGQTVLKGIGEPVTIEQLKGKVSVEHAKNELMVTNHNGDVLVSQCAGPISITAYHGTVTTRNVYGQQSIHCEQGKIVVDSPHGAVNAYQRGGDIRIIPLEGIGGNFDIQAEDGDVSILIPESADVTLLAIARNGQVRSAIPLTGEIGADYQRFQGRPLEGLDGQFQITIETQGGSIVID